MSHVPKPYFLQTRGVWKVQIRGKQLNFGTDEAEAFRLCHRLMAEPASAPVPVATPPHGTQEDGEDEVQQPGEQLRVRGASPTVLAPHTGRPAANHAQ